MKRFDLIRFMATVLLNLIKSPSTYVYSKPVLVPEKKLRRDENIVKEIPSATTVRQAIG